MRLFLCTVIATLMSCGDTDVDDGISHFFRGSDYSAIYRGWFQSDQVNHCFWRSGGREFQIIESHTVFTNDGVGHKIELLRKKDQYYLVIDEDTARKSKWGETSLRLIGDTIFIDISSPLTIVSVSNIASTEISIDNKDSQCLIEYTEGNMEYLTIADKERIQLDNDVELEVVAATEQVWNNQYYIFNQQESEWNSYKIAVSARCSPWPIATNLKGYFGLPHQDHAGCMTFTDFDYFRLDPDTVIFCFSLGSSFGEYMFWTAGEQYHTYITSKGTIRLRSETSVIMTYSVEFYFTSKEDTIPLFTHRNNYSIAYSQYDPDSAWRPDQLRMGFKVDGEYQSVFYPEIEMMHELCELKESGTTRQKSYLKDLDCDIGFYR